MTATSRERILAKIRTSLGRNGEDETRRDTVAERLSAHHKGIIPKRGQLSGKDLIDLFCKMAEGVQASVARISSPDEVPAAVSDYLRSKNLSQQVRMGADARLAAMPWKDQPNLEVMQGRAEGSEEAGVSHAFAGIAETGTLVLTSGNDNPTTINFLPEHHIAVVNAADLSGDMEAVWAKVRGKYGEGTMPRTVNLVTGPSRSADIEQTLLLGAHGPRALHVIVVEEG
ncbi:lactate utilization protein [Stappia sp. GBMRC 2046]|uniref:Lactate utilization protein n=1 Tax=Stappia sediminis TaxID=2692190 RepID=A0A7X3LW74_9HYPH|nr:lactate utilization protein [Stappia sediminis]MXN66205.1 lactate utilization protein [Stappia sediminis]